MPALYKDYDACVSQLGSIYRTICLAHMLMIVSRALCKDVSLRASRSLSAGFVDSDPGVKVVTGDGELPL